MSYCRIVPGVSDVYLIATIDPTECDLGQALDGDFVCIGCNLDGVDNVMSTPTAALAHLEQHIQAGHLVPASALERLRAEI